MGEMELLLSQLIQRRDPASPQPPDYLRKCLQVVANGSHSIALIGHPLHELIQEWSEDRQGAPKGEGSGTKFNKERFCFHLEGKHAFQTSCQ
jgi:hypothetical protein